MSETPEEAHRPVAEAGGTSQAARSADGASFDEVFCDLLHRLYRRAAMLVGSRQSAEDAVHEVYVKLAQRPHTFLSHPEPYAYAFSALVSVVRDSWRRERKHVLVEDVAPLQAGLTHWDGGVERRASELEVVRLLSRLSVRQAGVVVLVDLDGYTIDQAAETLRLHRGTVSRTRARALNKLRGELGPVHSSAPGSSAPGSSSAGQERRHA